MKYDFFADTRKDDYLNCIIFDIETASSMDELLKIKELPLEEQLQYLDIKNAKYLAFAVPSRIAKNRKVFGFYQEAYRDFTIYYHTEPISYRRMQDVLLSFRDEIEGYIAYNGNRFDFLLFRDKVYIENKKGTYYIVYFDTDKSGKLYKRYIKLIDPYRIAKVISPKASLEHMAELFSITKKNTYTETLIYRYNVNDVKVLIDLIYEYRKRNYYRTPQRTARVFLSSYMINQHHIKSIETDYPEEAFPDYAGGITEVFSHYAEAGYCYDFNSLYPSVLSNFLYQDINYGFIRVNPDEVKNEIKKICRESFEIAVQSDFDPHKIKAYFDGLPRHYLLKIRVLDTTEHPFPLPYSYTYDNRRIYYIEKYQTYQAFGYELFFLNFLKNFEIEIAYAYIPQKNLFANFYQNIYYERKRLKAMNDEREQLLKIIMNSSYGLFGLRESLNKVKIKQKLAEKYIEFMEKTIETDDFVTYVNDKYKIEYHKKDNEYIFSGRVFSHMSIPAYAVLTTSHARFWLYSHIYHILASGYRVFYVDTDSIFTDCPSLSTSDEMLSLKKEYNFENAFFFARKSYILTKDHQTKLKLKGTGEALKKSFILLSMNHPEPVISVRQFIDPTKPPLKIPDEDFTSKYNFDDIPLEHSFRKLFELYENIYHENLFEKLFGKIA